jgi:deoxyribonuclease V
MEPTRWPTEPEALEHLQAELSGLESNLWTPPDEPAVGGCFVCFARGGSGRGARGDLGWAAAVVMVGRSRLSSSVVAGESEAPYAVGLLAAREGPLLAAAIGSLPGPPDVLLVNATGLDHQRRAGLALHLGWATGLPTVGVTHRPLLATADDPPPSTGAASPMRIDGEQVGWLLRTRATALPVAVSPGWRTGLDTAREIVLAAAWQVRAPEPLRQARRLARTARSRETS